MRSHRSSCVHARSSQRCTPAASATNAHRRREGDPRHVQPRPFGRHLQQQRDAGRIEDEHERHDEGGQRVLPRAQAWPVRRALGGRVAGTRPARPERPSSGERRAEEDEHVGDVIGRAERDERGRCDDGREDVGRRHREDPSGCGDAKRGDSRDHRQAPAHPRHEPRAELRRSAGHGGDTDHDARRGADRGDAQDLLGAIPQRKREPARAHPGVAADDRRRAGDERRTKHGDDGRISGGQQDHERNDPRTMVRMPPRQRRGGPRVRGGARLTRRSGLPRIDFRHQEQRQVPEKRRDGCHQQYVEVANAQKFRHQESGRTEHGRCDERTQRGGRDQSAGPFVAMPRIRWPRRRRRAHLRGSDDGTGCATHQHRLQHDRPPGPRASARRGGNAPGAEESERTRLLEHRREDREQDDERRRSGHRVAEHALRRLVEAPRQTGDIHACAG